MLSLCVWQIYILLTLSLPPLSLALALCLSSVGYAIAQPTNKRILLFRDFIIHRSRYTPRSIVIIICWKRAIHCIVYECDSVFSDRTIINTHPTHTHARTHIRTLKPIIEISDAAFIYISSECYRKFFLRCVCIASRVFSGTRKGFLPFSIFISGLTLVFLYIIR